jgi:hypothetical protein
MSAELRDAVLAETAELREEARYWKMKARQQRDKARFKEPQ